MKQSRVIIWFRQDLRLSDNPALTAALAHKDVFPIYILDNNNADVFAPGAASRWWLHHSLLALSQSLHGKLNLYQGDASRIILELCQRFSISSVYWNRNYDASSVSRDTDIKNELLRQGIQATSFNGSLLHEPWTVLKKDGSPYKVFTPYHRQASIRDVNEIPLPRLEKKSSSFQFDDQSVDLDAFELLPQVNWASSFHTCWTPGEDGARLSLERFLANGLDEYKNGRDYPALETVSKLSPHLHFGEISAKQINYALLTVPADDNSEHFKREIRWREFSYYLLFHWPNLPKKNLKTNFDHFQWKNNPDELTRWQQGLTGYPLVDAGMRELWQTGTMHNRVRMITASFLIKNLLIDWRLGAQWFWDCLVDADLASNSASWQWVAGCGTDASPYFRIFNPVTQGEKFDAEGEYTKRYVPELKNLPKKYLFRPWEAPSDVLEKAGVILGQNYPSPVVDIRASRIRALDTYNIAKTFRDK